MKQQHAGPVLASPNRALKKEIPAQGRDDCTMVGATVLIV